MLFSSMKKIACIALIVSGCVEKSAGFTTLSHISHNQHTLKLVNPKLHVSGYKNNNMMKPKTRSPLPFALHMSTVENTEVEQLDPIQQEVKLIQSMDLNSIINTVVIILITTAVLSKVATVDSGMMRGWTAAEMALRIPIDNFNGYSSILESAPVSTKAFTSATVYAIGDFISQKTEGKDIGDLDRGRIIRSTLAGLIGHGPLSHVWYNVSEDFFEEVLRWTEWWSFFPKVVIDQILWGPFWNNTYIVLLGIMKLEDPKIVWEDIKKSTIPLVVSGLKLWPLAHCVTYGLMPVPYRLVWVDFVEILWVVILSSQAAAAGAERSEGDAEVKAETA